MSISGKKRAAETWKCPDFRKVFRPGTFFIVREMAPPPHWWGCADCAGVYAALTGEPEAAKLGK
jgi:hypothetical protein